MKTLCNLVNYALFPTFLKFSVGTTTQLSWHFRKSSGIYHERWARVLNRSMKIWLIKRWFWNHGVNTMAFSLNKINIMGVCRGIRLQFTIIPSFRSIYIIGARKTICRRNYYEFRSDLHDCSKRWSECCHLWGYLNCIVSIDISTTNQNLEKKSSFSCYFVMLYQIWSSFVRFQQVNSGLWEGNVTMIHALGTEAHSWWYRTSHYPRAR